MSEPSATSFLKMLERSGIVADDRLKAELDNLSEKAAGRLVNVRELAGHLVDSGLITQWHTDKLLAGKYKGFFLGKFKLLGHLGSGGMSSVYLAQHKISEQFRAIKVLPRKKVSDKSYLDRFYLEARAAASLNHPNVVRIYDICNENDTHYMVMEYVKGKDLHEVVKESGALGLEEALKFCIQAADGLTHAHQRELVHRDIKPANLVRTAEGEVKILDLGLALVNQDDSESLTVLYNEKVMGTADYLSPEQAVNSHEVDSRADIYSLGCTLYFLLTGHPPFPDGTLAQRIAKHQTQEPADIRVSRADCPEAIVTVCQKMMRKSVDDRYQTCDEVKLELQKLVESGVCNQPVEAFTGGGAEHAASTYTAPATAAKSKNSDSDEAFLIDTTTGSSKSDTHKSSKSRKPILPRKKVKAPPKWLLPLVIAVMFVILVTVLSIAYKLIKQNSPTEESRKIERTSEQRLAELTAFEWARLKQM